jgi:hypothetical protein
MRRRVAHLIVILGLTAGLAHAQHAASTTPTENDMYCSGVVTTDKVPTDTYIISGEESDQRILWKEGRLVFINKGAKQGVKVGDQYFVVRPESDQQMATQWVKWQASINKAMGTDWADLARLRVANVQENTSTAEVIKACDYVERGDIVLPFAPREAPQYKPEAKFDIFAPPSGKAKAMIAAKMRFGVQSAAGNVVYVNLGAKQGVQVGNYFRVFRYQDNHHSTVYEIPKADYMTFGYGSAPKPYGWSDLPRDILGEGIVLRVGPNAATVLLTYSVRDIYVGDYVELE